MIRRLESTSSRLDAWIRSVANAVNAVLKRVDGNQKSTAADYTATLFDTYVLVTNTGAARTVTLLQKAPVNFKITIKDTSGGAATNNITIQRGGSDTIDGGTSTTISTNYGVKTLFSDGAGGWWTS